ncbi:MAG: hypothetical protein R3E01_06650 [Pirellulaceae bacterium]|nr:hypothetical protein [Planctomycetales bacterium]
MRNMQVYLCGLYVFVGVSVASAVTPPMPPLTNGDGDATHNGMKHALVSQAGNALAVHVSDPPPTPVVMTSGFGVDYTPDKFNVLENVYFNAQHGWLPDGPFNLPADSAIWIERTGATQPAGSTFRVYDGGNGSEGMAVWTMDELYTSNGFRWKWDGVMQHDYFTADSAGDYSMSFHVYVGDLQGNPLTSMTGADATFQFRVVPEPPMMSLLAVVTVTAIAFGRRRTT